MDMDKEEQKDQEVCFPSFAENNIPQKPTWVFSKLLLTFENNLKK